MTEPRTRERGPRVVQVMGSFCGGGAQRLAWNLAEGLAPHSDSFALALKRDGLPSDLSVMDGRAEELVVATGGLMGRLASLFELRRWMKHRDIELVHIHGSGTLPFVVLATLGLRIRRVFTWHDSSEVLAGRFRTRALRRWALRRCDVLFGSSRAVAERLAIATARPARVWPNGVRISDPDQREQGRPPTIIWMGRFVPPKDPQALVRAAKTLRDEGLDFRVIMLGDALAHLRWFHDQTLELIVSLGLGDIFETPGWVGDPSQTLGRADIAVQTSHTEGLSLALLEQMMAGLAIVATDVGDTSTAIEDGVSGLLIPKEDDEALAGALRSILTTEGRARALGLRAKARAEACFSVRSMSEFALERYNSAIGRA